MNGRRDLEILLRADLANLADGNVLDGQVESILARTGRLGQRPAWIAQLLEASGVHAVGRRPSTSALIWIAAGAALLVALGAAAALLGHPSPPPPPFNGRIVFGRFDQALGDTVVYTANPDGTHVMKVQTEPAENPHWSVDGTEILLGDRIVTPDGTIVRQFSPGSGTFHVECSEWSPDASRLLCEGFDDDAVADASAHGIYTIRASDGGDLRRLTTPGTAAAPGSWSPDGSTIVYTATLPAAPNVSRLMVMKADGSDQRQLGDLDVGPSVDFAPDGQSVLVVSQGGVFTVDVASGVATPLRLAPAVPDPILSAVWSPDGTRLLVRRSVGNVDLFTVRPDGTDLVRVTNDPDDDRFMDWGVHPLIP